MSGGLAAFQAARLDEDEAAAMAAAQSGNQFTEPGGHDPRWQRMEGHNGGEIRDMCSHQRGCIVVFDEGAPGPEEAAHIARHDPSRALREVEAKRNRLALLDEAIDEMDRQLADDDAEKIVQGVAIGRAETARIAVMHDAAVYSDHPDYQEAWKP